MSEFTDIQSEDWIDRHLSVFMRPYARLMRLDRPIGTWLLLLPCWWGVALASPGLPNFLLLAIFALGAVVMRGAGCVINDIYDRKLDALVERTRNRPLASGEIKLWQALLFLGLLLLIGLVILLIFNPLTILIGLASMALVATYPLMKRITWWPQLFLGFTFNWGALLGWTAVRGTFEWPAILLYSAGIFWTLGYDTIYAHQDKRDDALIGVKSTARLFGEHSRRYVALFYLVAILLLALVGWTDGLSQSFYILLFMGLVFVTFEITRWQVNDPADCLNRFRRNRDFGMIIFIGLIVGHHL